MEDLNDVLETRWTNYGDMNPEPHGGCFVRWCVESQSWDVVTTWPEVDINAHCDDERVQRVGELEVQLSDVWVGGEPENGFTDRMADVLRALHEDGGKPGPSPEPDSPRFLENANYYVADMPGNFGDYLETLGEDYDSYEEMVAAYGVDDW